MKKKQALTLLEIMIVIFLIGLIASVIGVNMKGSLDAGRAFKTEKAQEQICDILMLEVARGASIDEVVKNAEKYLDASGMVNDASKFILDGWGQQFEITQDKGDIVVSSDRLKEYKQRKDAKTGKTQATVPN
jgi:prepilin-type N-terminal cleavage/methylation domain-containing protein